MNRLVLPVISASALIFGFILASEEAAAQMTAKDLVSGTPEENKAIVQGSFAYFGTYSVSETDKAITTHVESCTFPNWNGIQRKTSFNISGDELSTTSTIGAGAVHTVWKRAK